MRKALVILAAWMVAAGGIPAGAQAPDDWTAPYRPAMLPAFAEDMLAHADAPKYAIEMALSITDEGTIITGRQVVRYVNRAGVPLDEIVFRLYPNLRSYGGEMQVSDVTADGAAVEPALDESGSVLRVVLPNPLAAGVDTEIGMDYTITVTRDRAPLYGQFSDQDGVLALPNAYPVLSVYKPGVGWWTVTDHPQGDVVFSETAFYTVSVTAPPDLILAASGSEVDLTAYADGTLTHHYVAPLVRDFALMASADYVSLTGEQDGVRISVFYDARLPNATAAAQAGLDMTRESVRIFNAAFGAYPFAELDIVQTPNTAGGIEYPGLFVVGRDVWNRDDSFFEFVIVHEAAHQWWYSLVGNDQALHPWIDEGLAQYAVALYIRAREGDGGYRAALDSFRAQHEGYREANPGLVTSLGEPVVRYPGSAYFFVIYQKGPLFFAALDDAYGFDTTLRLLQAYFAAFRYAIAAPEDMLASFESTLGEQLDAMFAEWIGEAAFAVG